MAGFSCPRIACNGKKKGFLLLAPELYSSNRSLSAVEILYELLNAIIPGKTSFIKMLVYM